jgi:protein-disulfide isomerase
MSKSVSCARTGAALAGALALAALAGCDAAPKGASDPEAAKVAAQVGERAITIGELDTHIKEGLFRDASEDGAPAKLYELRSQAIEEMIDEQLLAAEAKARGLSVEDLTQLELSKAKPVEQAEIQQFYDQIKARLGKTPMEAVTDQIRQRLQAQRQAETRQAFVAGLRQKANVSVLIEPPRIEVAAEGPSLGPANAPVTIVEFSDYQCPFCKRAEPTVHQIAQRYPEKVRIVYRHFPLDNIHPQARGASEAAACAEEQGKFWEYHEQVFQSSPKLEKEALRQAAEKAKLDLASYDQCVAERRHQAKVEKDLEAGRAAGVSGTPAFFVNGIPLSGAQPPEKFVDLIEKELQQPKPPAS